MRRDACRFLLILSYAGLKTAYAPYSTQRIYGRISKRPEILCHAMVLEGAYAGLYIGENSMEQFFQVGIITSAHGVHGEVKVYPTTDDAKRFRRLKESGTGGFRQPFSIPDSIENIRNLRKCECRYTGKHQRRDPGNRERQVLQAVCNPEIQGNRHNGSC